MPHRKHPAAARRLPPTIHSLTVRKKLSSTV
jgi:hypothetical protein